MTSSPRFIQTPNFPDTYTWDLTCTYVLQTNEGSRVNIEFDPESSIQTSTNCRNDALEINLSGDVTQDGTK